MGNIILPVGNQTIGSTTPTPDLTDLVIGTETFKINKDGNAVDDKGIVLKTKEELEKLKTPTETEEQKTARLAKEQKDAEIEKQLIEGAELEIDDVKYKLNKDGAAVDATGKVVKTKAELKALLATAPEEETNYIAEIQKATNLVINDESGKPITYENTLPGITQYAQDVYKEGEKIGYTKYEQELLSKFPIIGDIIEHLSVNNGSLTGFNESVDYSKITIGDDEAQQVDVFTKAKLAQGVPQAEITDMIGYYKTDKKLKAAAEAGLTYLKTAQDTRLADRQKTVAATKLAEEQAATKYWNDINGIITSKQIVVNDKKFNIPDVIKIKEADGKIVTKTPKDFIDYIKKPLNFKLEDGKVYTMTQHDYDEYTENIKRTPHNDLFEAYRRFVKYDDSQLIVANANNGVVKEIIKLKTKASSGAGDPSIKNTGKITLPIK